MKLLSGLFVKIVLFAAFTIETNSTFPWKFSNLSSLLWSKSQSNKTNRMGISLFDGWPQDFTYAQRQYKSNKPSPYANIRKVLEGKNRKLEVNKEIRKEAIKRNKVTLIAVAVGFCVISTLWTFGNCFGYYRKKKELAEMQSAQVRAMDESCS